MVDADATTTGMGTGVPQLDRILGGGLLRGALVLVTGAPGTGKTILAQQMVFHHAARGASALYLTGYSEPHDKLLLHTRSLTFFRPELIGTRVQFLSLLDLLRAGLDETEEAIVRTVRAQGATLVVLDGFKGMRGLLPEEQAAGFLHSLGSKLALVGATTIVVAEGNPDEPGRYSEMTVCDVILALRRESMGSRRRRLLEVIKARGAASLDGAHPFVIGPDGLRLFPRFESVGGTPETVWPGGRASLGSPTVDALLGGGPNVGTSTLVVGTPGVGKTLLGLHFAADGARLHEPTLILNLSESAAQLRTLASTFGMDLAAAEARGDLRLITRPSVDLEADEVAQLISQDVERRGVRRLVLDSLVELERAIGSKKRKLGFLAALVHYLRSRSVTTYVTRNLSTVVGSELDLGAIAGAVVAENLLLLRSVEYDGQLHRVLSVLKMRFSDYDKTIQEYAISTERGLTVLGPAPRGEGLLTGLVPMVPVAPRDRAAEDT